MLAPKFCPVTFQVTEASQASLLSKTELLDPAGIGIAILTVTAPTEAGFPAGLSIVPGLLWLPILKNGKVSQDFCPARKVCRMAATASLHLVANKQNPVLFWLMPSPALVNQ